MEPEVKAEESVEPKVEDRVGQWKALMSKAQDLYSSMEKWEMDACDEWMDAITN